MAFWNRNKNKEKLELLHKTLDIMDQDGKTGPQACLFVCPEQQQIGKACICINCPQRGKCGAEQIVAAARDCENRWVKYCSVKAINTNNPDMVKTIVRDIAQDFNRRMVLHGQTIEEQNTGNEPT